MKEDTERPFLYFLFTVHNKRINGITTEAQKGIKHRFLRFEIEHPLPMNEDEGYEPEHPVEPIIEKVFVEVRPEQVKKMRIGERRKQYVNQCVQKSGIETISLYAPLHDQEDITIEETVTLPEKSVEDLALYEIELEILRGALAKLSDAEFNLIYSLFLSVMLRCVLTKSVTIAKSFMLISEQDD